jgi:hypothetical protein
MLLAALVLLAALNLHNYKMLNNHFVWSAPELAANRVIAENIYLKFTKANSIMVFRAGVRGYLNTLFDRGIYESMTFYSAIEIAYAQDRRYAIEIKPNEGYDYYDLLTNETFNVRLNNGNLFEQEIDSNKDVTQVLDFTDANWTNGVANTLHNEAILLFKDTIFTRNALIGKTPKSLLLNGIEYEVKEITISNPGGFIRVTMQDRETALKFAYPAQFEIQY